MNLDEINRDLKSIQALVNNQPVDDFDGLSPSDMFYLIHKTFDPDSPFQFKQPVDETLMNQIPFLKLTEYYLQLIRKHEQVELTLRGNLPVKIVKELYAQKIIPEEFVESGLIKLYKEENSAVIHTLRIISELAELTKKRKGKLTLTEKCKLLLDKSSKFELFKVLFITYAMRFKWAYLDGYGDHPVGQLGFAFTIEQLIKHGDTERRDTFYGEKYLKAFPAIIEHIEPVSYETREEHLISCFSHRTFEKFLKLFGFIEIRGEEKRYFSWKKIFIKKTKLLDEVIKFI